MAPAHAGGLLSGDSNKGALVVVSPNVDLGVGNIPSGHGFLNGNKTGLLSGILNGNQTSIDGNGIGNDNNRGYNKKKRRHQIKQPISAEEGATAYFVILGPTKRIHNRLISLM